MVADDWRLGIMWLSYSISLRVTKGRMHGSAIAILIGLVLAYIGGEVKGESKGIADVECLAGIGLMGGAMTATFYTELGCLLGPSLAFVVIRAIVGS